MESDTPNWQPLSMLPTIGRMIDEGIVEAREHWALMASARDRPHVLDDATVARSIALYTDVRDMMWVYKQLKRWMTESPSGSERRDIERLAAQLPVWSASVSDILALDEELKRGTIQALLAMSDEQLGLKALAHRIRRS